MIERRMGFWEMAGLLTSVEDALNELPDDQVEGLEERIATVRAQLGRLQGEKIELSAHEPRKVDQNLNLRLLVEVLRESKGHLDGVYLAHARNFLAWLAPLSEKSEFVSLGKV